MRGVCFSLFPLSSSPSLSSRALGKTEKTYLLALLLLRFVIPAFSITPVPSRVANEQLQKNSLSKKGKRKRNRHRNLPRPPPPSSKNENEKKKTLLFFLINFLYLLCWRTPSDPAMITTSAMSMKSPWSTMPVSDAMALAAARASLIGCWK